VTSRRFAREHVPPASCIFEHVYLRGGLAHLRALVQQSREEMGGNWRARAAWRRTGVPVPDSGVTARWAMPRERNRSTLG